MAKAKKPKRRFKSRSKLITKGPGSAKKQNTKYTGPGPRQVTAAAIARRNKAEDENDGDGSNWSRRKRRIASY
jgi:hypothetical protein